MCRSFSIALGLVLSMTFSAALLAQDGAQAAKVKHQARHTRVAAQAQRTCSWIGPGARAVYRCETGPQVTAVAPVAAPRRRLFAVAQGDPPRRAVVDPPGDPLPQPICGWVGPGGRAIYQCH